ncbi:MAG: tetratricopeptide repeat protein [Acidobacteria bacterium]|nr:tetratricopeptide repeat protein [Acidobacteriota bacterium]
MNKKTLLYFVLLFSLVFSLSACGGWSRPEASTPLPPLPPAKALPSEDDTLESAIRFLEDRVKDNPSDFVAYNMLASRYLARMRQSTNMNYLELASRAVKASLEIAPKEVNKGALSALADIQFTTHEFAAARDNAEVLIKMDPGMLGAYQLYADSMLELGDYEKAIKVHQMVGKRNYANPFNVPSIEIRYARIASLHGKLEEAKKHLLIALAFLLDETQPERENVAWLRWYLGETTFSMGKYEEAEKHYRDALITYPDYFRAVGSLGRVLAAKGELKGAIEQYEKVVNLVPDPIFVAALGDLYKLSGRDKEASAQYQLVEQIARLSTLNGAIYNRQLALFYADHDIKTEEAYLLASKEYEVRKDIYGADAVAWTALKAGKIPQAQVAIKEALRFGTQDAKLFYHAAMIAQATSDKKSAKDYLEQALKLNPEFDPLQSPIALKTLETLK